MKRTEYHREFWRRNAARRNAERHHRRQCKQWTRWLLEELGILKRAVKVAPERVLDPSSAICRYEPLNPEMAEALRRNVLVDTESGCWITDRENQTNYGRFRFRGRTMAAHRAAWECYRGPIPDGMLVCHSCDNPPCRNPNHLFLGSHRDNMEDASKKGRLNRVSKALPRVSSTAELDRIAKWVEETT